MPASLASPITDGALPTLGRVEVPALDDVGLTDLSERDELLDSLLRLARVAGLGRLYLGSLVVNEHEFTSRDGRESFFNRPIHHLFYFQFLKFSINIPFLFKNSRNSSEFQ